MLSALGPFYLHESPFLHGQILYLADRWWSGHGLLRPTVGIKYHDRAVPDHHVLRGDPVAEEDSSQSSLCLLNGENALPDRLLTIPIRAQIQVSVFRVEA
jgi:hypothetical protein